MLTKIDLQSIREVIGDELKSVKTSIDTLSQKVGKLETKVGKLETKVGKMEEKLDFTHNAAINILEWSDEIHQAVVKNKLVNRIEHLERIIKTS